MTKSISIGLALAFCVALSACATSPAAVAIAPAPMAEGRQIIPLTAGWRFHYGEAGEAPAAAAFDDSAWQEVSVPHSWNRIGAYALERGGETNNTQGVGWYRLTMAAPAAEPGLRQYLDFAAVGNIADVWVNGVHVGQHRGAFSRFRLEVTEAWRPGASNLIAVRADNSRPAIGSSTENIIPLAGDFFIHGGIYRDAQLLQLPAAAIDPLDHGGPGVYARTVALSDTSAEVEVLTRLNNHSAAQQLTLATEIRNAGGVVVAHRDSVFAPSAGRSEVVTTLTIPDPQRWQGRDNAYLYTVTASLYAGQHLLDSVSQPLGLREIRVDPDEGFFLNGEYLKLKGVSRHQDWLGSGWALTPAQHRRDMELIAEMGANSVRQAHYQHADIWSDLADEAGMIVWAELPYVGTPSLSGGEGSPELWANAEQQLRELIRQNYNHPSIAMWSIGNEVDSAAAFGAMTEDPLPLALLQRLQQVAKEEDPTRATVFADFSENLGAFGEHRQPMTGVADMVGYNRYVGWYMLQNAQAGRVLGGMLDQLHGLHPTVPMSVSEYGAGGAITQHSDDPASGYVAFAGRPQPEEYESYVHELNWSAIESRDYLFASWIWNMFDFASDLRNEGDAVDINTKGLVTMDRAVKKDAFYYYQAAWSDAPMVHLTGMRYANRSYPVMDVRAYTNAPTAMLLIDGAEYGEVSCANFTCVWPGVPLKPGLNTMAVQAHGLTSSASFRGIDPRADGVFLNAGDLAASVLDGRRYGSDTFVTGGRAAARFAGRIGSVSAGANVAVQAAQPNLFDYWREGDAFAYAIPLPDGAWTVTIHTLDPGVRPAAGGASAALLGTSGATQQSVVMAVSANGTPVIERLTVAEAAGGAMIGLARSFPVTVSGGMLPLEFTGVGGLALVAAIEVTPR